MRGSSGRSRVTLRHVSDLIAGRSPAPAVDEPMGAGRRGRVRPTRLDARSPGGRPRPARRRVGRRRSRTRGGRCLGASPRPRRSRAASASIRSLEPSCDQVRAGQRPRPAPGSGRRRRPRPTTLRAVAARPSNDGREVVRRPTGPTSRAPDGPPARMELDLLIGRADDPRGIVAVGVALDRRGDRRRAPRPSTTASAVASSGRRPGRNVSAQPGREDRAAVRARRELGVGVAAIGSAHAFFASPLASFIRRYASMKPSRLPSSTARGLPTSWLGPQVLDELVRLEDVRADLAAEADLALLVVLLGEVGLALLFLQADQLGLEQGQGVGVVLVLRPLAPRLGGDAGREVRVADARLGLVLVLAAGAAASGRRRASARRRGGRCRSSRRSRAGRRPRRTTSAAAPAESYGLIRTRRWTPVSPWR